MLPQIKAWRINLNHNHQPDSSSQSTDSDSSSSPESEVNPNKKESCRYFRLMEVPNQFRGICAVDLSHLQLRRSSNFRRQFRILDLTSQVDFHEFPVPPQNQKTALLTAAGFEKIWIDWNKKKDKLLILPEFEAVVPKIIKWLSDSKTFISSFEPLPVTAYVIKARPSIANKRKVESLSPVSSPELKSTTEPEQQAKRTKTVSMTLTEVPTPFGTVFAPSDSPFLQYAREACKNHSRKSQPLPIGRGSTDDDDRKESAEFKMKQSQERRDFHLKLLAAKHQATKEALARMATVAIVPQSSEESCLKGMVCSKSAVV